MHGTNVLKDGTWLSDHDLPDDASLTVLLVDHADVREHDATEHEAREARRVEPEMQTPGAN